eukprot:357971-Chlamydomonas_euryale.AAC.1
MRPLRHADADAGGNGGNGGNSGEPAVAVGKKRSAVASCGAAAAARSASAPAARPLAGGGGSRGGGGTDGAVAEAAALRSVTRPPSPPRDVAVAAAAAGCRAKGSYRSVFSHRQASKFACVGSVNAPGKASGRRRVCICVCGGGVGGALRVLHMRRSKLLSTQAPHTCACRESGVLLLNT